MSAKQTQTQSMESNPWAPSQAPLQGILNKAQSLGSNTNLFRPVQGATTRDALQQTKDIANQGSAALPVLQNMTQGYQGGFNTGLGTLQTAASGGNLGQVSPHLQAALDRASQNTANTVNQQFAASGRYGSANHAGTIADRVGAIQTNALVDNYNQERANQLSASNTLYGGGATGANMAGAVDQARLFAPGLLGQVGAQEDAYKTAQRQAPLNALQFQSGMTVPIAGLGGTQDGTTTSSSSNPLGTAIGIGSTLAGMAFGMPPGMGSMAGGAGGGLFSMLSGN